MLQTPDTRENPIAKPLRSRLQRCKHFIPGLRNTPWWRPEDIPLTRQLEENFEAIRGEFFDIVLAGSLRIHPESQGGPRPPITDGVWNIFELLSNGYPNLGNAVETPFTANLVRSIPEFASHPMGLAYFSVLNPGVRILPHCGPTNSRIRIHLGIYIPDGATMRVGTETVAWKEGRCLVFDDSWEHEAFNPSDRMRAVLLIDTWHPDLTVQQRVSLLNPSSELAGARNRERQGWCPQPDSPGEMQSTSSPQLTSTINAFKALNRDRLDSIEASAIGQLNCGDYTSVAAAHVLACLGRRTAVGNAVPGETDASNLAIANSLRRAFATPDGQWITIEGLVNLVHICALYWQSSPTVRQSMYEFAGRWPTADKIDLFNQLASSKSPLCMMDRLIEIFADVNRAPPFGATAAVLVAALRSWHAGIGDKTTRE